MMNRFKKILILFLFQMSYLYGAYPTLDSLLKDAEFSFNGQINIQQRNLKNFEEEIARDGKYASSYTINSAKIVKERLEKIQKEYELFKKKINESPKEVYAKYYEQRVSSYTPLIQQIKDYIKKNPNSPSIAMYKTALKEKEEFMKKLTNEWNDYNKPKTSLGSLMKNSTTKVVDTSNIKVVPLNSISTKTQTEQNINNKQVVEIKSSGLNTVTTLNNVNIGSKAKANVGGVSIGVEEKE